MFERYFVFTIFLVTYLFIILGRVRRSVIVFTMGMVIAFAKVIESMKTHNVGLFIDFNTIGLLLGMMILVGLLKDTGLFQYLAIKVVRLVGNDFWKLVIYMMIVIALLSAVLDNVTTVLLLSPILLLIADTVRMDPTPLIVLAVTASNVGGTMTMIGDPPNILVASAAKIGFLRFAAFMTPPSLLILGLVLLYFKRLLGLRSGMGVRMRQLRLMDEKELLANKRLLKRLLVVFFGVIALFVIHEQMDLEMATIALTGAAVATLISGKTFDEVVKSVEWDSIFLFIGLFMLSFALEEVGIIGHLGDALARVAHGDMVLRLAVIWISGLSSAFIGAVPTVTVMIPVLRGIEYTSTIHWYCLALGASLGGIGTLVGTASNIVGVGMLENHIGSKITYSRFFRINFPLMLLVLSVASGYVSLF
ncbi:MAG: citrate transporter [Thermotogae bacterium]|nr:MAG: citrate transporter [Thermotogota bacterium]